MASTRRKVSFYRISLEEHIDIKEKNTLQKVILSNEKIEEAFKYIYDNKMRILENNNKAINVDTHRNKYVIEVTNYEDHMVFLKIGQQNHANTVALRDEETLESEEVPMTKTQLLELFTFCLIDFETGIISYIGINGAPRISAIRALFDNILIKEKNIHTVLAAILTNDIIEIITRKNIISKLSVTFAIPSDTVLSNDIGVSKTDFDMLQNIKTKIATYNIQGARNKNIFSDGNVVKRMVSSLKEKHGDNLKSVSVNAKDHNESSQPYNLLHYCFTKTVDLGGDNHTTLAEDDFKKALKETYDSNKDDLLRYI